MNEKTIDQIEEEVLSDEVSDEAVEAAGTRTEIAGVWTFICTGIQYNHNVSDGGRLVRSLRAYRAECVGSMPEVRPRRRIDS
jgi:hypothetical protein